LKLLYRGRLNLPVNLVDQLLNVGIVGLDAHPLRLDLDYRRAILYRNR
jgi:hypothetical protein